MRRLFSPFSSLTTCFVASTLPCTTSILWSPTVTCSHRRCQSDPTAPLRGRIQELELEVKLLRRQIDEQQERLRKVELENDGTHALATNDKELENALKKKVRRITLKENQRFTLLPVPFQLRDATVTLTGGKGSVIEGSLKLVKSHVDCCDIEFEAPSASLPIIDATTNSSVSLHRCALRNGRDGVFLSISTHAHLHDCVVEGNIRGLFEGHHCKAVCRETKFRNNIFHCVFLSSPSSHSRVKHFVAAPQSNVFEGDSRGDAAFQYNPVEDRYADVIKGGTPVVLTSESSTTNLSDESW